MPRRPPPFCKRDAHRLDLDHKWPLFFQPILLANPFHLPRLDGSLGILGHTADDLQANHLMRLPLLHASLNF